MKYSTARSRRERGESAVATRARRETLRDDADDGRGKDDEEEDALRRAELTNEQARIAAIALDALYDRASVTRVDDAEAARRGRFELILREAVARAKKSCETEGERSGACVTAWEEVSEVRDAAARAGVRTTHRTSVGGGVEEDAAAREAKAREMRERLRRDPLLGATPCSHMGECTVAEGTLEARGRFARALDEEDDARGDEADARAIEDAVKRAMSLCANGASREACALAWEEVEDLTNWGGKGKNRRRGD